PRVSRPPLSGIPNRGGSERPGWSGSRRRRHWGPPGALIPLADEPVSHPERHHHGGECPHRCRCGVEEVDYDDLSHYREESDENDRFGLDDAPLMDDDDPERVVELQSDQESQDLAEDGLEDLR